MKAKKNLLDPKQSPIIAQKRAQTRLNYYYVTARLDWLLWLGFGIGDLDWGLLLGIKIGIRIGDGDWELVLGIEIGDWDLGFGIGIGGWGLGLGFGIGD